LHEYFKENSEFQPSLILLWRKAYMVGQFRCTICQRCCKFKPWSLPYSVKVPSIV